MSENCVFCGDNRGLLIGNFDEGPTCIRCAESARRRNRYEHRATINRLESELAEARAVVAEVKQLAADNPNFIMTVMVRNLLYGRPATGSILREGDQA